MTSFLAVRAWTRPTRLTTTSCCGQKGLLTIAEMIKFGVPLGFEFLQWKVLWVPSLLIYFLSVYSLRYQRARQLGKRYGAHAVCVFDGFFSTSL